MYGDSTRALRNFLKRRGLTLSDVYAYFIDFTPNAHINSPFPFRMKKDSYDATPSLLISEHKGELRFKDFGALPQQVVNDAVGFVQLLYGGITREDAIKIIIETVTTNAVRKTNFKTQAKVNKIAVPRNTMYSFELEYWTKLGISKKALEDASIYALDYYAINGRDVWTSEQHAPKFYYLLGKDSWQLYNPYGEKRQKFKLNNVKDVIIDYNLLPNTGKYLFISKSKKDCMVWRSLGVKAVCAPINESTFFTPLIDRADELNSRFEKTFILFDNDDTGRVGADYLANETKWIPLILDYPEGCKDPADVITEYGTMQGRNLITKLFYGKYRKHK